MGLKSFHELNDRVFDLLDNNCLKASGFSESQLLGPIGALSLATLKNNAKALGYDYFAFRHPLRPGKLIVENLITGECRLWRQLECAKLLDQLCPGLQTLWKHRQDSPELWDMIYPPVNTNSLMYATALEYLAHIYPDAVVTWVELAIVYENELKIYHAVDQIFYECRDVSRNWRIVAHVLGYKLDDEAVDEKTL